MDVAFVGVLLAFSAPVTAAIIKFMPARKTHGGVSEQVCRERHKALDRSVDSLVDEVKRLNVLVVRLLIHNGIEVDT